jgi:hypothetical protein
MLISLFSEDGIGDTGTAVILPLAPERLKQPMQINRRQFNYGLALSLGSVSLGHFAIKSQLRGQSQLRTNQQRIMAHIFGLAEFGKNPQGGVSRVAYSDADKQGREYVLGLLKSARLEVTVDAAGNLIGKRPGSDKAETTTASSARWARLKLPRHLRKRTSPCDIRWKSSSFKTKKAV